MPVASRRQFLLAGGAALFAAPAPAVLAARTLKDAQGDDVTIGKLDRILSIGGDVTEIVFALGEGKRVIATDTTSLYPDEVTTLPKVGYMRALSTEGVLSTSPDLVLASAGSGPPEVIAVLKQSRIPVALIDYRPGTKAIAGKISLVADILDVKARGAALSTKIAADLARLAKALEGINPRRALFVLSLTGGRIIAAGQGSSAEEIIRLAGGINAIQGFDGFKQASAEAVLAAEPEAIIMMAREGDISGEELFAMEPFARTPAARTGMLIRMDGSYLLGFGPRTPQAARELARRLHPGIAL